MIRIVPFLVSGFLLLMWVVFEFWAPVPRGPSLYSSVRAGVAETRTSLDPAVSSASGRIIKRPLAFLILDVSGSMKSDTDFKQRIAAELFDYFFAVLSERDVSVEDSDKIHLAVATFPDSGKHRGCVVENWNGRPWISMASGSKSYKENAEAAISDIGGRLDRLIGRPGGRNQRDGQSTPHDDAVVAADNLVGEYRQAFGDEADIFTVYFTDEAIGDDCVRSAEAKGLRYFGFQPVGVFSNGGKAYEVVSRDPKVELICHIWLQEEPRVMVDRFLRALRLEPEDAATGFRDGFPSDRITALVPLVIQVPQKFLFSSKVDLRNDLGSPVHLREMGDTFYTVLDPSDPVIRNSTSLHLDAPQGSIVTIYQRPQWALSVDPAVVGLLEAQQTAKVTLAYSSPLPSNFPLRQAARLRSEIGHFEKPLELDWDSGSNAFLGDISDFRSLAGQGQYLVCWEAPDGTRLEFPFHVRADFDIRFLELDSQYTGRSLRGMRTVPKR
jgi:hypothetical protein